IPAHPFLLPLSPYGSLLTSSCKDLLLPPRTESSHSKRADHQARHSERHCVRILRFCWYSHNCDQEYRTPGINVLIHRDSTSAPPAPFQDDRAVYHDDIGDYSTNEPTMDGTASAIFLWAMLAASR